MLNSLNVSFFNGVSSINLIKFSRDDIKVHIYAFQVCFVLFGLVFCAIFLPTFKCVKLQKKGSQCNKRQGPVTVESHKAYSVYSHEVTFYVAEKVRDCQTGLLRCVSQLGLFGL